MWTWQRGYEYPTDYYGISCKNGATYLRVSQNHFDLWIFAFQKRSNTYNKGVNQESQHYNEILNTDTQHGLR